MPELLSPSEATNYCLYCTGGCPLCQQEAVTERREKRRNAAEIALAVTAGRISLDEGVALYANLFDSYDLQALCDRERTRDHHEACRRSFARLITKIKAGKIKRARKVAVDACQACGRVPGNPHVCRCVHCPEIEPEDERPCITPGCPRKSLKSCGMCRGCYKKLPDKERNALARERNSKGGPYDDDDTEPFHPERGPYRLREKEPTPAQKEHGLPGDLEPDLPPLVQVEYERGHARALPEGLRAYGAAWPNGSSNGAVATEHRPRLDEKIPKISKAKIKVLIERRRLRQELHHPDDAGVNQAEILNRVGELREKIGLKHAVDLFDLRRTGEKVEERMKSTGRGKIRGIGYVVKIRKYRARPWRKFKGQYQRWNLGYYRSYDEAYHVIERWQTLADQEMPDGRKRGFDAAAAMIQAERGRKLDGATSDDWADLQQTWREINGAERARRIYEAAE